MTAASNQYSLAIVGDGSSGKSSITRAFQADGFSKVYKQTVGIDFYEKKVRIRTNIQMSLRVWDIGGQSLNSKNLQQYLSNVTAVLLLYDITSYESFANLSDWLAKIKQYNQKSCRMYVVGNKMDLMHLRQVNELQHDSFVRENALQGSFFMSAKTGENVLSSFYSIAGDLVNIKLTSQELAVHDKVLKAYIIKDNDDNGDNSMNEYAAAIAAEDLKAEEEKRRRDEGGNNCQCTCS